MKRVFLAATSVLGVAAFGYTVYAVGAREIRNVLVQIGWGFGAILLVSGAREAVRAVAWSCSLDKSVELSFRNAFAARLVGEALNALLPMGFLVGEPAKAAHVADRVPFTTAFGALMIEFAFYSASLLALFGAVVLLLLPPSVAFGCAALLVLTFVVLRKHRHPFRRLSALASRYHHRACAIIALEIAYHALGIVEVYTILGLVDSQRPSWASAVALEAVNRIVTIVFKMLPMRVGVDEVAAAMVANQLGMGTSTGVIVALARKIRLLFWSAVGLVLLLMRVRRQIAPGHARVDLADALPLPGASH